MKGWSFLLMGCVVLAVAVGCYRRQDTTARDAEFVLVNGAEPETLDPHLSSGLREHRIFLSLFEGLVSVDPATGEPLPGLAERWETDEAERVYTFYIRETTWSDGVPITAQTVYDSWMRELAPETATPYAWLFPGLVIKGAREYTTGQGSAEEVGLRVVDKRTFAVTLQGPAPYFLNLLSHYSFAVVPLHSIEEYGASWTSPEHFVGNGPFVLESWEPQDKITCVPNPLYWDKESVHLERITYLALEDSGTAFQMYLNGEIDWLPSESIPPERFEQALNLEAVQVTPTLSTYYYDFNVNKPPLDDVRVRKALAMSLDRGPLIERILKGGESPAYGMIPPLPGYDAIQESPYDVPAARGFLAEAGYPDGKGFPKLTILYNTSRRHKEVAEYVQSEWNEALGIEVSLQNMEWKTFLPARRLGDYQIARDGWVGAYVDPTAFMVLFTSESAVNAPGWRQPAFDALLEQASKRQGGPARMALLAEAERLLVTEETAVMPLFHYVDIDLIDTHRWEGWYPSSLMVHPTKSLRPAVQR